MNFIIQDMLDFSQIKSGKFRKNFSSFNIKDTVSKVMKMQAQKAKHKDLKFEVEFLSILDSQESSNFPYICCDEQRIMQVLINL